MSDEIAPATDPAEILAAIPRLTDPQFRIIKSSDLGRVIFVEAREGWYVLRLPMRSELGIDRVLEFQIHRAMADCGLAPKIVWGNPVSGALVTEWQTGGVWRKRICARADLSTLAALLRTVHEQKLPVSRLHYGARLQHYLRQATEHFDRDALAPIKQAAIELTHFVESLEPRIGLCHHDPLRPNIVCRDDQPVLIDWEYAALGDIRFDLAAICLDNRLDLQGQMALVQAYGSGLEAGELRPFELLCRLTDALWYGAQGEPMVIGALLDEIKKITD